MARRSRSASCNPPRGQAFNCGRRSVLALRGHQFKPGSNFSIKIDQKSYCRDKGISRWVVRTFIKKKWLAVSVINRKIFVEEICPDEIEAWIFNPFKRFKNPHTQNPP